jgi:hypothetical protein
MERSTNSHKLDWPDVDKLHQDLAIVARLTQWGERPNLKASWESNARSGEYCSGRTGG